MKQELCIRTTKKNGKFHETHALNSDIQLEMAQDVVSYTCKSSAKAGSHPNDCLKLES
jgi:hypothetical protein